MITKEHFRQLNIRAFPQHLWYDPKVIVLGVNNVCNLHCKMCDVGTQTLDTNFAQNLLGSKPLNMPLDLLKNIIDQMATDFPKTPLAYAFTEPLVYTHLIESLSYAKEKGVPTSLTTNGLGLKHKAEKLVKAGLGQINISLDGTAAIHNEIRGHKSSFEQAIEGIIELGKFENPPKITLIFAITTWNTGNLKGFIDFFRALPITEIGFMHTQFADPQSVENHNQIWGDVYPATVSNIAETQLETMDIDLLWEQITQIKSEKYPFNYYFSPNITTKEDLKTYYFKPEIFMAKRCQAIFGNMMIKSNGSVIPAHGRCYNLEVGNVYENDLKSIWNSSVLSKFRKDVSENGGFLPACSRCCSAV